MSMNIARMMADRLASTVSSVLSLVESILAAPLNLLLAHTPAGRLLRQRSHQDDCLEHLAREAMRLPETADDLLVHGQRLAYAQSILPPSEHPTWYVDVPRHLRKSIVTHGRIRGTDLPPAQVLAGGALTADYIRQAWRASVEAGARAAWVAAVLLLLVLAPLTLQSAMQAAAPVAEPVSRLEPGQIAAQFTDVWSPQDGERVQKQIDADAAAAAFRPRIEAAVSRWTALPVAVAMTLLAVSLLGLAVGRLVFIGRLRWLAWSGAAAAVADLRRPFREALQKWRYFLADRATNEAGYADQVHFAMNVDRSPRIYYGDAEGVAEFSGHILGPRRGHEMSQSVVDMLQHTMVLGGSGESKSRDVYVPVMAQLLAYRKAGYPIAMFVTDDKGAIVDDVRKLTSKLDLGDDLLIIGTAPGEWRVDLMDVGKPYLVAEFIKSASRQAGAGAGADDFWPEMGNDLALNIWTVTEAAQRTTAGEQWEADHGMRLHSIKAMLELAISDEQLEWALGVVADAMLSDEYVRLADLDNEALHGAMGYLLEQWLPMTAATRDGIKANLRKALRTFTFKPEIARGFADGVGERLLPASEMRCNKIKVINVSQIEHGSAGRLVSIMLKTAFFKQARDVQQQDPGFADERLAWWFNPQLDDPRKDAFYLDFFMADEYQSLITNDPASGYSDATVWNVLRSAGVGAFTISQGLGAYESAIGREAAQNILRNWRSKHFLRTEDVATIEEAKKLAGKTIRFHVSDWDHYESTVAVRRELGTDPDNLRAATWRDHTPAGLHFGAMAFGTWDAAHQYDGRFVQASRYATDGGGLVGAMQAAAWRVEDRQTSVMQHGLIDTDVVREEQIMQMTRGRSLSMLQVAGGTQVDIVRLNARAYRRIDETETLSQNS